MKQLSASKVRPRYRLSPNEVENLKKEETERRRKLRIVQVREQSKEAAAKIRNDVKQERKRQIIKLAQEIEGQLEDEKQEEVKRLEQRYDNTLRSIGQGHTQASIIDKKPLEAERRCVVLENRQRAEERHQEAVRRLALDKAYKEYEETKHIRDRQAALVEEKKRAAEIAARPPPPPDPVNDALLEKCKYKRPIPMTDLNAFSATHYHIPDFAVEKAPPQQQRDAIRAGEEEDIRTKEEVAERKKKQHDQIVRARIRGSEALKKELLKHDYEAMMTDLSLQQRADRRHRQQVVSKLPKQVFLPPDRRLEELQEKQLEMERAFEDLYTHQMNISGDLSLTLDPNPIPSTPVEGDEESHTESPVVMATIPTVNPALREVTNLSRSAKLDTQQGQSESVLKKLLKRIKEQRSEAAASAGRKELAGPAKLAAPADSGPAAPADSGPAARPPVAKPAPDPELDLSPLRAAPGNQKPQRSPVKPSSPETETGDSEVSADTEASFLEKLKDRIQNIEAQRNVLEQKMREQLQQPPPSVQSAAELPAQSSGFSLSTEVLTVKPPTTRGNLPRSAGLPTVTSQPVTTVTSLPRTTAVFAEPTSLVSGPLYDVPVKSTDLWKKTEYGLNVRQETSGESTLASGLSTQQVSFQPRTSAGLYRAGPTHFDYLTSGIPAPLASQMMTSAPFLPAQPRFIGAIVPGSSSVVVGGQTSILQKGQTGDRGLVDVGVSVGYPISSLSAPYSTSSSAFVSVASGSLRSQPFLSLELGGVPSAPGLQPQLSSLAGPLSALTSQSGSLAERLRASLRDAGDGQPSTLPGQAERLEVDYGLLAERLAIGLPEQDRLLRVKEYQRHLVEKHQERIKTLQEVRARIEARQASSTLQQANSSLSASLQLPNPALMVPYTLKTSQMLSSSSSLGTSSSSLLYHGPGAKATERPGFVGPAQEKKTAAELVTAGEASSSGLSGTTVSSGIFTTAEPILAGSTGSAGLLKNIHQPFSYGLAFKSQTDPQMQADALEKMSALAGSRRSSSGSSNRLDDVRKSLPFDNPDDTLHRNEGGEDAGGLSINDDSHLSSSTDRGSPFLGSHSNKSSAKPQTALSEGSLKLLGGSSLVAMAQEKRINFEKQQEKLRDQFANIQRQKDILLQHYQGNWQQISTREEDLRLKLKSAQALSSSSSKAGTTAQQVMPATLRSVPALPVPAKALSLGVWQSCSPSMDLEEKSDLGDRASLSSQRTGGSTARSWAMELEEFSIDRSQGDQGAAAYQSPGNMTVEEVSINSDFSKGKEGLERGTEKTASLKYWSSDEPRPLSSLSSLEEYPIDNSCSRSFTDLKGVQEASQEDVPSEVPYEDSLDTASARDLYNLRDVMADLLAAGSYFSQAKDGVSESSARAAQPPTRQPATVAGYQPHGLSTILEVDTPQTAARSTATNSSRLLSNGDVTEKPLAKRFIDFDQQSNVLPEGAVFSADEPWRGHAMHNDADVGLVSAESSRESGTMQVSSEKTESSLNTVSGFTTVTDTGDHQRPPREASASSSTHEYQPLELMADSLLSQSLSLEEFQILPSERSQGGEELLEVSRGCGDSTWSARLVPAYTGEATRISQAKVDSVMAQAQQYSLDMLNTIQRRAADVFDQSGLPSTMDTNPGD